jgi:hypothetical protein
MSLIMHFDRNDTNAATLDGGTSITQTGAYTGTIRQASVGAGASGAQYLDFVFKSDDGRTCNVRLYVTKNDGSEAFVRKIFDALLVVIGAQSADVVEGKVYTRDKNAPGGVRVDQGYRVPAVEGKPVGMLLQRENYTYSGRESYRLNLLTPFDPKTRRVAKEILAGAAEAKLLDLRIASTHDRTSQSAQASAPSTAPAGGFTTSDVPF